MAGGSPGLSRFLNRGSVLFCVITAMFFNPELPLRKHLNHLPHWQQDSAWVFITWRLADSVPAGLLEKWIADRDEWMSQHEKPWDEDTEREFRIRFSAQLEEWMDQGMGECVLRNSACAELVARTILHFDRERYLIDGFVIMPNHVHLLVQLVPGFPLETLVHSWKRYSARQINEVLGRSGKLWHKRYWDTLVRSEEHFWKIRRYISRNPVKAGLTENEYLLYLPWDKKG